MSEFLLFASSDMNSLERYFSSWTVLPIMLLILGLGLLIVEMITPGLGAPGICGAIALVAAVVIQAKSLTDALITIAAIIVVLFIAAFIIFRSFTRGRISKTDIMLDDVIDGKSSDKSAVSDMVGKTGVALNDLRPSGFADFGGRRLDVVTNGEFVKKGDSVVITEIDGMKIVVKKS